MTTRNLTITAGSLLATLVAANLRAQAPKTAEQAPSCVTTAGIDVSSAYIFRGATLFDKPVAQPYLSAALSCGVTVGAWANVALDDSDEYGGDAGDISEIDLNAEYALPLGKSPISASVAYTEYTYPNTVDVNEDGTINGPSEDDREVGLKLALATDCALDKALNPTLGVFYGLDGAIDKTLYAELGLSHDLSLSEELALGLGGTLGYASPDEGSDGLSAATLSAKLKAKCGATIGVTYVIETDEDVLAIDEEVVGTIGYSKSL